MEVVEEETVYPTEVLDLLEDRDEDELVHEQLITLENLTRHCRVNDLDTLEELSDELSEIESLKHRHIYKLLEVVPQNESTVRAVFQKERVKLDDDEIDSILDICESIEIEE